MKKGVPDLYDSALLDLARQKKWVGRIEKPELHSQASNPRCGDEIELLVRLGKSGKVEKISFEASACVLCLASANAMGEAIRGLGESETKSIHRHFERFLEGESGEHSPKVTEKRKSTRAAFEQMKFFSGVREFGSRISCVLLPWQALDLAWKNKKGGSHRKGAAP